MARSHGYLVTAALIGVATLIACGPSGQDARDHRRALAQRACEDAIRDQLTSRATAHFSTDAEHVFYDSLGGAGVTGSVSTTAGDRSFACLLKPTDDSAWTLTAARLLN